jgi:zinc transporter ZupT
VLSAFVFGLVASSALVIGAVAGAHWTPPRPLLASALAFASGALITALVSPLRPRLRLSARRLASLGGLSAFQLVVL